MKSTITHLYDYRQAEMPGELRLWRIKDEEIEEKLRVLGHDHAIESEPDTVDLHDSVACRGESESARWNRPVLLFYPGRGLCDAAVENALVGARTGERRTVPVPEGSVTLTVTRIIRRRDMPVGDALVRAEGIEGVNTVADYFRWYRAQNEPERRYTAGMRMAYFLLHQVEKRSEFAFDEAEKQAFLRDRVERIYQAMVRAGMDPTVPREGLDFLTEEQAKADLCAQYEHTFRTYVACGYLVRTLGGVHDLDAFCEAGFEKLATDNHMTAEEMLSSNGRTICCDKLLQDRALELLAAYAEPFLED